MEENNPLPENLARRLPYWAAGALVFARLVLLLALPLEGLRGYGDLTFYEQVAQIPGWPYLNYWVEYPPLFPFLSAAIYRLAGGQSHVFSYLMALMFLAADALNAALFTRLALRLHGGLHALGRAAAYLLILAALAYSWTYFDPLPVSMMLLGLAYLLEGREIRAGLALGLGIALKFFPALALAAAWRRLPAGRIVRMALVSLLPLAVTVGAVWAASPAYTRASLLSQGEKGSWQTPWALLDGNLRTGVFGGMVERLDPAEAFRPRGAPAAVPPLASLAVFGGLGLWGLLRARPLPAPQPMRDRQAVAVAGYAWCLFLLWSPGWSPQWVLYLIPLALLALPARQGVLVIPALILVNLLEWPVLLSRGLFWALPLTVLLRALIFAALAAYFFTVMTARPRAA